MAQPNNTQVGGHRNPKVPINVTYEPVGGNDNKAAFERLLEHLRELGYKLAGSKESSDVEQKSK